MHVLSRNIFSSCYIHLEAQKKVEIKKELVFIVNLNDSFGFFQVQFDGFSDRVSYSKSHKQNHNLPADIFFRC